MTVQKMRQPSDIIVIVVHVSPCLRTYPTINQWMIVAITATCLSEPPSLTWEVNCLEQDDFERSLQVPNVDPRFWIVDLNKLLPVGHGSDLNRFKFFKTWNTVEESQKKKKFSDTIFKHQPWFLLLIHSNAFHHGGVAVIPQPQGEAVVWHEEPLHTGTGGLKKDFLSQSKQDNQPRQNVLLSLSSLCAGQDLEWGCRDFPLLRWIWEGSEWLGGTFSPVNELIYWFLR